MSVMGIFSPRCCSFLSGSWLRVSGRNIPSSPNTETGTKLIKNRSESSSAVAREYFEVIESFLCELTKNQGGWMLPEGLRSEKGMIGTGVVYLQIVFWSSDCSRFGNRGNAD